MPKTYMLLVYYYSFNPFFPSTGNASFNIHKLNINNIDASLVHSFSIILPSLRKQNTFEETTPSTQGSALIFPLARRLYFSIFYRPVRNGLKNRIFLISRPGKGGKGMEDLRLNRGLKRSINASLGSFPRVGRINYATSWSVNCERHSMDHLSFFI